MGYYQRKAGGAVAGMMAAVLGIALISAWPWMLGTYIATRNGAAKGSTAYDLAGWLPETAWIVVVIVGLLIGYRNSIRRGQQVAQLRAERAIFDAPRAAASGGSYTHGACTIAHRTIGAAARCTSRR
jgi:hypothetical protein